MVADIAINILLAEDIAMQYIDVADIAINNMQYNTP
jgi:hypothetical protein